MRLLLDTVALLRWNSGRLDVRAVRAVERASVVAVSAASAWEIAVKRTVGKLRFDGPVAETLTRNGFAELPVTVRHADAMLALPAHHSDSVDRLIIAQAIDEGYTIVTTDRAFELYRVPVIWV
jgi:PIN domain nuclease of toxin-antitoxin system